jgi:replicative DNA helicase
VSFLYQRSSERLLKRIAEELQLGGDVSERMEQAKQQFERVTRSQFVLPDLRFDMQIALNDVLNPKRVMRTCYDKLDDVIVGLRGGRLYVLGARPGVGKTLVGMQVAWELSKSRGVVFGSWEMSKSELLKRVFSQELEIEMSKIEADNIGQGDKQRIQDLIIKADEQLFIADDPRMTIDAFRRFILNSKKSKNIDVVFVDYLQLIPVERSFDSVRNKVDYVTMELKRIAREFDVAVVALAQLNRGAEEDKAPQAKDFKESGQIEQEADVVVLLHRKESQFDKDLNFEREANGLQKIKNLMVFDVAKNRHGAVGGFVMSVLGQYSRLGVH